MYIYTYVQYKYMYFLIYFSSFCPYFLLIFTPMEIWLRKLRRALHRNLSQWTKVPFPEDLDWSPALRYYVRFT